MPRLWILSDLHEEISPETVRRFDPPDFDILVCAGDVREGDVRGCVEGVARVAAGKPAVMALGNHDYYGLPIDRAALVARKIGLPLGVHVLERSAVEIGGLHFAGGTLWEPHALPDDAKPDLSDIIAGTTPSFFAPMQSAPFGEPVHVEDADGTRPATFADIRARRVQTLAAIAAAQADVIVTHYPPTRRDLEHAGSAGTWIHGHAHVFGREVVDGIDVVVNAVPSRLFAPRMVIEVQPRPRASPGPTA